MVLWFLKETIALSVLLSAFHLFQPARWSAHRLSWASQSELYIAQWNPTMWCNFWDLNFIGSASVRVRYKCYQCTDRCWRIYNNSVPTSVRSSGAQYFAGWNMTSYAEIKIKVQRSFFLGCQSLGAELDAAMISWPHHLSTFLKTD